LAGHKFVSLYPWFGFWQARQPRAGNKLWETLTLLYLWLKLVLVDKFYKKIQPTGGGD